MILWRQRAWPTKEWPKRWGPGDQHEPVLGRRPALRTVNGRTTCAANKGGTLARFLHTPGEIHSVPISHVTSVHVLAVHLRVTSIWLLLEDYE